MAKVFLDGNEAISRAALKVGCTFFAGYPITPATPVFNHMLQFLPPNGGICLQGEDEISSIGFCLGASMGGAKVMTATSGPGISLYSEHISFAIGSEIPIVIVDVQRLGPSTGSATKGADGDIQFLRWGNSGGLPVIVLAPVDVKDSYELTYQAFNFSEKYRCPVFIATNKEIATTRESLDLSNLMLPEIVTRKKGDKKAEAHPFGVKGEEMVPPFLPLGGPLLSRQTSSTHGEDGYITGDPDCIAAGIKRLKNKLEIARNDLAIYEISGNSNDPVLIIAFGVSARAAMTAIRELHKLGRHVSLLVLKTLYPVPEKIITDNIVHRKEIFVVEMNCGQYVREIERLAAGSSITLIDQMNGELISPATIVREVLR